MSNTRSLLPDVALGMSSSIEHGQVSLMLQCVAVCCSVLQCSAVWCSVVQCGAVWCGVLWYSAV